MASYHNHIPKPGPDDALRISSSHCPSGYESSCPGYGQTHLDGNNMPWLEGLGCPLRHLSELTWPALGFGSLPLRTVLPESTSSDWLFSHGQTGGIDCSPGEAIYKDTLRKRGRGRGTWESWIKPKVLGFYLVQVLLGAVVSHRASLPIPHKDLASEPNS